MTMTVKLKIVINVLIIAFSGIIIDFTCILNFNYYYIIALMINNVYYVMKVKTWFWMKKSGNANVCKDSSLT